MSTTKTPINLHNTPHEQGELDPDRSFTVQTPEEFRDDFSAAIQNATDQVGLEVMQFEVCDNTQPIFEAFEAAADRGVPDVRFHYDRVARRHIRVGESQAWSLLGKTVIHQGDKASLRMANIEREGLVDQFETKGITSPENKKRGTWSRMSHNHVKLAIADETAWFGTMNLRDLDFRISNCMVKVTESQAVAALKEIFNDTETGDAHEDRAIPLESSSSTQTELLLDVGEKGQSVIYDKAVNMLQSLNPGDSFTMISQWPPVKMMFGELLEVADQKAADGATGTFLISPEDQLHPSRRVSRMLQRSVMDKYAHNENVNVTNLPKQTHLKVLLVTRANGDREVLFGSHNFSKRTVKNGTRELAMYTNDPVIVSQIEQLLHEVQN